KAWEAAYPDLSAERPGLLGAVVARAEPQVIRLALVYALLDCTHQIDVVHLEAAMAVWAYCEESATRIFGDSLGDPIADEILLALRRSGSMRRLVVFCATCGVTLKSRMSDTKSAVSKPLSAPTVMRLAPGE